MFPLGSDYRPTRAEMEGRQAPPPPDVLQRSLSQAGDGVLAAWEELEEALGRLLTGAPREAALPCLLATAALHALHTRLALVGRTFDSAHAPVEATPLGLFAYLTVQILAFSALYFCASAAEALACWARGPGAAQRNARALRAAAPLVFGLAFYLPLAFYGTVWPDASFQASAIAPKAALGVPIRSWMHETHLGPALLSALDLAGGRAAAGGSASRRALAAAAALYAVFYSAQLHWLAARSGAWVYPFLSRLNAWGRLAFCAASAAAFAGLTLLARAAVEARARLAAPSPRPSAATAAKAKSQ